MKQHIQEWPQFMAMSEFRHMTTSFFDSWNIGDSHFSSIAMMVQHLMVAVNYYGNFLFMHTFALICVAKRLLQLYSCKFTAIVVYGNFLYIYAHISTLKSHLYS